MESLLQEQRPNWQVGFIEPWQSRIEEQDLASIIIGLQFGTVFFLALIFWAAPRER
jgi:hypothetical protein